MEGSLRARPARFSPLVAWHRLRLYLSLGANQIIHCLHRGNPLRARRFSHGGIPTNAVDAARRRSAFHPGLTSAQPYETRCPTQLDSQDKKRHAVYKAMTRLFATQVLAKRSRDPGLSRKVKRQGVPSNGNANL